MGSNFEMEPIIPMRWTFDEGIRASCDAFSIAIPDGYRILESQDVNSEDNDITFSAVPKANEDNENSFRIAIRIAENLPEDAFEEHGIDVYYSSKGGLPNLELVALPGVCWGLITSDRVSFRIKDRDSFYSSGSPTLIAKQSSTRSSTLDLLAYLNSNIAQQALQILNPTLNTTAGDVLALQKLITDDSIEPLAAQCIDLSAVNDCRVETSQDFKRNPLI